MADGVPDITLYLERAAAGDEEAANELLPLVYDELRALAHRQFDAGDPGHTLEPTGLVHEAFLRLLGGREPPSFTRRAHFFGAAARAMRRILVERARRSMRDKRGGGRHRLTLDEAIMTPDEQSSEIIALDEALDELRALDPRKSDIVMLRYFAGLTIEQTAQALGISKTTVSDEWSFARDWLHTQIRSS